MITRYAKAALLATSLLLSLTAQAATYSFIGGATFDVYYDTSVLGNNVSLSGNTLSLDFGDAASNFYLNTSSSSLVVVPHAGYQLSHYAPGIASATATLNGPAEWNATGTTGLEGGTFSGSVFSSQNFVAETSTYGSGQLFQGDSRTETLTSGYDIAYYDMEEGANYAAYGVSFQGSVSAYAEDNDNVLLQSPNVSFSFATTGAPMAPVPETSTWLMMAAGIALLTARAKAKRSAV